MREEPAARPDPSATSASSVLTAEDRERIRREVFVHAELRSEGPASPGRAGPGGQATAMIIRQLGSKVMITMVIGLFGTLFTVAAAAYHNYFAQTSAQTDVSDNIGAANRDKKVSLLSTFPNDLETSHSILAVLQSRRIWLSTHRATADVDGLGRTHAEVLDEFWQLSKVHLLGKKPAAILTEVKVFFDSPEVNATVDSVRDACLRESASTTEDDLRATVRETQEHMERLIAAMSDEVNDSTRRPKHARGAASSSDGGTEHAARTLGIP